MARRPKYTGEKTITITCDTSAVNRMVDALGTDIMKAIRPAAQAGAQVLYDGVKRNVARMGKVTGNLDRSIYQVYSKKFSDENTATYHISWNYMKAPHGRLLEWGYMQRYRTILNKQGEWVTLKNRPITPRRVGAKPFIRPAQALFPEAVAAMETKLLRELGLL